MKIWSFLILVSYAQINFWTREGSQSATPVVVVVVVVVVTVFEKCLRLSYYATDCNETSRTRS